MAKNLAYLEQLICRFENALPGCCNILYTDTTPTAAPEGDHVWAINSVTGDTYFKNESNVWQQVMYGGLQLKTNSVLNPVQHTLDLVDSETVSVVYEDNGQVSFHATAQPDTLQEIHHTDTNSVALLGEGTTTSPLTAAVRISPTKAGNILGVQGDGLYVVADPPFELNVTTLPDEAGVTYDNTTNTLNVPPVEFPEPEVPYELNLTQDPEGEVSYDPDTNTLNIPPAPAPFELILTTVDDTQPTYNPATNTLNIPPVVLPDSEPPFELVLTTLGANTASYDASTNTLNVPPYELTLTTFEDTQATYNPETNTLNVPPVGEGGGGAYIPLAGTDVGAPVTGPIETESTIVFNTGTNTVTLQPSTLSNNYSILFPNTTGGSFNLPLTVNGVSADGNGNITLPGYNLTLTTDGTSGAATYDSGTQTLNIPIYGGGGGGTTRFGIEDNIGLQHRTVDFAGEYTFIIDNTFLSRMTSAVGDNVASIVTYGSGPAGQIHLFAGNAISNNSLFVQNTYTQLLNKNSNTFINTPTDIAIGTYNLPISVNGNVADSTGNITIATGGGSATRFGIEDNTGIQNRLINMGGYNFTQTNIADIFFTAENGGNSFISMYGDSLGKRVLLQGSNNAGTVLGTLEVSESTARLTKYSATNHSHVDVLATGIELLTTNGTDQLQVRFPYITDRTGNYVLPISVNGQVADATGNITVSTGGGGSDTTTASNGLTEFTDDIQLGGTLFKETIIDTDAYTLALTGTGAPFSSTSEGEVAVQATSTNAPNIWAGQFRSFTTANNIAVPVIALIAGPSAVGGSAIGHGSAISFQAATTAFNRELGTYAIRYSDNDDAGRDSYEQLGLYNNGNFFIGREMSTLGQLKLNKYGINTFAGTATYLLGVDASGNVVETAPSGGGGADTVSRFGYTGEDTTAGEHRSFDFGAFSVNMSGTDGTSSVYHYAGADSAGTSLGGPEGNYYYRLLSNAAQIGVDNPAGWQQGRSQVVPRFDGLETSTEIYASRINGSFQMTHQSLIVKEGEILFDGSLLSVGDLNIKMQNLPSGTAATYLALDSSNRVVTSAAPGGGGGITTEADPLAWKLLGNAGTVAGTNFLGTTDNVPVQFRVNNASAGYIGISPIYATTFGVLTMRPTVNTGVKNSAFGAGTLYNNTTGTGNSAFGYTSLYNNTTGNYNMALGWAALGYNKTGSWNTAVGGGAMNTSTAAESFGSGNTAIGFNALRDLFTGDYNIGLGHEGGAYKTGASNTLFVSDNTTKMYMNLDAIATQPPTVVGIDSNGFWHKYDAPTGGSYELILTTTGTGAATYNPATDTLNIPTPVLNFADGAYTPSVLGSSNVSNTIISTAQWMRVGLTVTVSGKIEIDPTVGDTTTSVTLDIPYDASTVFSADHQAAGTAAVGDEQYAAIVRAVTGTARVRIEFKSKSAGVTRSIGTYPTFYYHYTYRMYPS